MLQRIARKFGILDLTTWPGVEEELRRELNATHQLLTHVNATFGELRQQVTALQTFSSELENRLAVLESGFAELLRTPDLPEFVESDTKDIPSDVDEYVEKIRSGDHEEILSATLAHAFRGSTKSVAERQALYLPVILAATPRDMPVIDLGCGRGEFLHLLRQEGFTAAVGVDTNGLYIRELQVRDFRVVEQDALEYLDSVRNESVAAITALQFVEHVSLEYLEKLLDLSFKKLCATGILLLETVNPYCISTFRTFYLDPSHIRPLPPPLLSLLMKIHGFAELRVFFSAPVPPPKLNLPALMPAFQYQDYAVLGRKTSLPQQPPA